MRHTVMRSILPHPRSPGGKPQRLTARVKIASAPVFPTASFCRRGQFPMCVCVCEFQNRTTQNSGAQAGASLPGGRAYMTTGKRPASGAPLRR